MNTILILPVDLARVFFIQLPLLACSDDRQLILMKYLNAQGRASVFFSVLKLFATSKPTRYKGCFRGITSGQQKHPHHPMLT